MKRLLTGLATVVLIAHASAAAACSDAGPDPLDPTGAFVGDVGAAIAAGQHDPGGVHTRSAPNGVSDPHRTVDDWNNVISNVTTPANILAEATFGAQMVKTSHALELGPFALPGTRGGVMEANTGLGRPLKGVDSIAYLVQLPTNIILTERAIAEGVRTGDPNAWNTALYWGATTTATGLAGGINGLQGIAWAASKLQAKRAARAAFDGVAPDAAAKLEGAAVRTAANGAARDASIAATDGAARRALATATRDAATRAAAGDGIKTAMGAASRTEGRALARAGSKAASEAALHATERAGATALGEAAARFVPGVNAAIAVCDVGVMIATFRDSHATPVQKAASAGVALGSIVAATNIPIVSQAGGAFSLAASMVPVAVEALPHIHFHIKL